MKMLEDLEEVVPGELDKSAPAVIWLQIDTTGDNDDRSEPWPGTDGVTWQDESIGGQEIQYVRADLYRDMAARLEAAERDAARYRVTQKITPYRFKKIQDASISDACDVLYFHKDRFDSEIDAMQETGR